MKIECIQGDITTMAIDAIVNAANSSLMGGGGVDGAIHRTGGSVILEDCRKIIAKQGRCNTGEAVITRAGKLPSSHVIHTVGPVWQGGDSGEPYFLASCYENSLKLAEENGLKTIAFPNISTGIYGFPKETAAKVAVETVSQFESNSIEGVVFVCFDEENFLLYQRLLS